MDVRESHKYASLRSKLELQIVQERIICKHYTTDERILKGSDVNI